MSTAIYKKTIANDYLGITKEIEGTSPAELKLKVKIELARWARREKHQRERKDMDFLRELAEYDTRQTKKYIDECKNIFRTNLDAVVKVDWTSLYNDSPYPPFVFEEPSPRLKWIAKKMGVPKKHFFTELFFPPAKAKRLKLENEAKQEFASQMQEYEKKQEAARILHEKQRATYIKEQSEYNRSVEILQLDFEKGLPEAVESFVRIALTGLAYPDTLELEFDARYDRAEKIVVVNGVFPAPWEMPRAVRYEYSEEENGIIAIEMQQEEFYDFYEAVLLQITFSCIHIIFESVRAGLIQQVGFNGLVKGPDSDTDDKSKHCILSCKVSRELFNSLDLTVMPAKKCFLNLKGVMGEPLAKLKPVQPVIEIKRTPTDLEAKDIPAENVLPKPEVYRPGDIEKTARELMTGMVEQIEKELNKANQTQKNIIH